MMQQYDKMILAILQGDDYHDAVHSLNEHGFYATVLNSSGGFLKKRSVTLMIGLESARLDEALAILKKHGERTEMRYEAPVLSPNMPPIPLSTAPLEIPTRCGGVVKPDVVLYGEPLDENVLDGAVKAIRAADNLIIGGTSLNVYPAAALVDYFRGENVVVINKGAPAKDMRGVTFIDGKIGEVFSQI